AGEEQRRRNDKLPHGVPPVGEPWDYAITPCRWQGCGTASGRFPELFLRCQPVEGRLGVASAGTPGSASRCIGQQAVVQAGPRSASSASRHSTSSRSAASPEKVRVTTPEGASVGENSTASRLSTASLPAGSTCRHLHDSTRSKRSAARRRRYCG